MTQRISCPIYKLIVISVCCFLNQAVFGQNTIYHEDFNGGLGAWTTLGHQTESAASFDYEKNIFTWDSDGISDLGWSWYRALESESIENGAVGFDATLYQLAENDQELPLQPYPLFDVELISPVFDISKETFVSISFFHTYAIFDSEPGGIQYAVKINAGEYSRWKDLRIESLDEAVPTTLTEIYIPEADSSETIQVKFRFASSFYYWYIDDFKIRSARPIDLAISQPLASMVNYQQPLSFFNNSKVTFAAVIHQNGHLDVENASMSVEVVHDKSEKVVYSNQTKITQIPSLSFSIDTFQTPWFPSVNDTGIYRVTYLVKDPSGEVQGETSYNFQLTDLHFSLGGAPKWGGNGIGTIYTSGKKSLTIGSPIIVPDDLEGNFWFEKVETGFELVEGGKIGDANLEFYLTILNDTIDFPHEFISANTSVKPSEHPNFSLIGKRTIELKNYEPKTLFSFKIHDPENPEKELDTIKSKVIPGKTYFLWVEIPANFQDILLACDISPYGDAVEIPPYDFMIPILIEDDRYYPFWDEFSYPMINTYIRTKLEVNIPEFKNTHIQVFPNPTTDIVNVNLKFTDAQNLTMTIFNTEGKVMFLNTKSNVLNEKLTFNTQSFPPGQYFLRLQSQIGHKTMQFVKL